MRLVTKLLVLALFPSCVIFPASSFAENRDGWMPFVQQPSKSFLNTVWFYYASSAHSKGPFSDFDECMRHARWATLQGASEGPELVFGCSYQSDNYYYAKLRNALAPSIVSFLCENLNPSSVRYFGWADDWGLREPKYYRCERR